jgi:hypothetical protein
LTLPLQVSPKHPQETFTIDPSFTSILLKMAIFEILANFEAVFRGEGVQIAKI